MEDRDMQLGVLGDMIGGGMAGMGETAGMANAVVCGNCAAAIDPASGEVVTPPPETDPMGGMGMPAAPPLM